MCPESSTLIVSGPIFAYCNCFNIFALDITSEVSGDVSTSSLTTMIESYDLLATCCMMLIRRCDTN